MNSTPVLWHIEISHYNEKARWALDYKSVPHVRKAPPPMLHMAWAFVLTRGKTFPVLQLDDRAIGDSSQIIEALESRYPEPPLYPADPIERARALALEDFFDEELGPYIRRWLFYEVMVGLEPDAFINGAMGSTPEFVKTVMRVGSPVSARMLRWRYGIDPESAKAARQKTEAAIERLEEEIQPNGYLVGEGFTVADLTAASLLFPLVRPPEAPHRFEGRMPEEMARYRDEISKGPGYQWVEEIYRRHRGTSAEALQRAA